MEGKMRKAHAVAIVPAAGYGKRLGGGTKKPFVLLRGKPIASYVLKALEDCRLVDAIFIAAEKGRIKDFQALISRFGFKKIIGVVAGGKTRQESVANCLKQVAPYFDVVLIHDAARPLIDRHTIEKSIGLARKFGACIAAVPENDTVKLADKSLFIKETIDRRRVFRAQTPQAFRFDIIKKAYSSARSLKKFTDDAGLVESLGCRVKILEGDRRNIKITTQEDLKLAEVLL